MNSTDEVWTLASAWLSDVWSQICDPHFEASSTLGPTAIPELVLLASLAADAGRKGLPSSIIDVGHATVVEHLASSAFPSPRPILIMMSALGIDGDARHETWLASSW